MRSKPKHSKTVDTPAEAAVEPAPFEFKGEIIGIIGRNITGYVWDVAHPDQPVEIEVLGTQGFYRRCIADENLPDQVVSEGPDRPCGFSLSLSDEALQAGATAVQVIVSGTSWTLPHRSGSETKNNDAGPIVGSMPWDILVHRIYWDLTGSAAPAACLAEETAMLERDVATATAALVRRLARSRASADQAGPPVPDGSFVMSAEQLVGEAYRGILGRDPEDHGFGIFGSAVRSGAPLAEVIKALIASAEFEVKWEQEHPREEPPAPALDPEMVAFKVDELIAAGYRTVLRREPEPESLSRIKVLSDRAFAPSV